MRGLELQGSAVSIYLNIYLNICFNIYISLLYFSIIEILKQVGAYQ